MSEAIYFLHINGTRVAELSDAQWVDMFWWDYHVSALTESGASIMRDPLVWEDVAFTIVDAFGYQPNPNTFSGGYDKFCDGLTDRLSFRSLPPPDTTDNHSGLHRFWLWMFGKRR